MANDIPVGDGCKGGTTAVSTRIDRSTGNRSTQHRHGSTMHSARSPTLRQQQQPTGDDGETIQDEANNDIDHDQQYTQKSHMSKHQDPLDDQWLACSVVAVDLERASLTKRYEGAHCHLAHDATASVNLYLDHRPELDHLVFNMTANIRQVFSSKATLTVKVQTATPRRRLEITVRSVAHMEYLHLRLEVIRSKLDHFQLFPRHQPKANAVRMDPSLAFVRAVTPPRDIISRPGSTPCTPSKKRAHQSGVESTATFKKPKAPKEEEEETIYRNQELFDPFMSSSPVQDSSSIVDWNQQPSSPLDRDSMMFSPEKSKTFEKAIKLFERLETPKQIIPTSRPARPNFTHASALLWSSIPSSRVPATLDTTSRPQQRPISREGPLGNISHIFAVLQSLFNLEPVKRDLGKPQWLDLVGNRDSLYRLLTEALVQKSRNAVTRTNASKIKTFINGAASRRQHMMDRIGAKEFLVQCIDTLHREFVRRQPSEICPVAGRFDCDVDHRLVCMGCGYEEVHQESYSQLDLDLPDDNMHTRRKTLDIETLLGQYFRSEEIAFDCESCSCGSAMVHRSISKLPDVLVLHLRRMPSKDIKANAVTLEERLNLEGLALAEALQNVTKTERATLASRVYQASDEDRVDHHPAIPSDGFPSSSSSRYSSTSPARRFQFPRELSPLSARLSGGYASSSSAMSPPPSDLYSDEDDEQFGLVLDAIEDPGVVTYTHDFDYDENEDEDEQLRWALEASLSQQSQEEVFNVSQEVEILAEELFTEVAETERRNKRLSLTRSQTASTSANGMQTSASVHTDLSHDADNDDDGAAEDDDSNGQDEDADLRAALKASLLPIFAGSKQVDELDLEEREQRDMQEAIRQSLIDVEANKENMSPEMELYAKGCKGGKGGKGENGKGGKGENGKTGKGSDSKRGANTVGDKRRRERASSEAGTNNYKRPTMKRTSTDVYKQEEAMVTPPASGNRLGGFGMGSTDSINDAVINWNQQQVQQQRQAKEKAKEKMMQSIIDRKPVRKILSQVKVEGPIAPGAYRLRAVINVTENKGGPSTLSGKAIDPSSTAAKFGRHLDDLVQYGCEALDQDGIWRCYTETTVTKTGSWADMNRKRDRQGYVLFYEREMVGTKTVIVSQRQSSSMVATAGSSSTSTSTTHIIPAFASTSSSSSSTTSARGSTFNHGNNLRY